MIKVLIVDDEPKLREGLRTLIPWEELGYTVVATAGNGIEALKKYHTFTPELIIADIRMPGMDGLGMLSSLREEGENCHVLILSGHADFEYAKQAISYRADGYLLKPVDEDEMIGLLNELRDKIHRERLLGMNRGTVPAPSRDALLRRLVQPGGSREEAEEAAAALGLSGGGLEVVLLELRQEGGEELERTEQVRSVLELNWPRYIPGQFFVYPPYLVLLLNKPLSGEADEEALYRELAGILGREDVKFHAAAGGVAETPAAACASFAHARELLQARFFGPQGTLLSGQAAEWLLPSAESEEEQDRDEESRLLLAVETGNSELIARQTGRILAKLAGEKRDERFIKDNLMRVISGVTARLETAFPEIRAFITRNAPVLGNVYTAGSLNELQARAAGYLQEIAENMGGGRGDEIKRIIDLVNRRYNENLKLVTLAEMFSYNSAYLGKMFRNYTGEHFNTYLDKVRIEKAKQFLSQGMKVYEVAERVGYMNPDYFNAKFRKYVGVSPTAFRKEQ